MRAKKKTNILEKNVQELNLILIPLICIIIMMKTIILIIIMMIWMIMMMMIMIKDYFSDWIKNKQYIFEMFFLNYIIYQDNDIITLYFTLTTHI